MLHESDQPSSNAGLKASRQNFSCVSSDADGCSVDYYFPPPDPASGPRVPPASRISSIRRIKSIPNLKAKPPRAFVNAPLALIQTDLHMMEILKWVLHDHAMKTEAPPATTKVAYGRKAAAQMLSVSLKTLDRLTERGLLRPSRALRTPLYSHLELERFMAATQDPEV